MCFRRVRLLLLLKRRRHTATEVVGGRGGVAKAEEEEFHFWQKLVFILGGWLLFFSVNSVIEVFEKRFFLVGDSASLVNGCLQVAKFFWLVLLLWVEKKKKRKEGKKEGRLLTQSECLWARICEQRRYL